MDNIEGMLRLLMNNPHNLTLFKYPSDITQRARVESITPTTQKFQRKTASVIRGFSADSMVQTNQQFTQHSMEGSKSPLNIEPLTTLSSTAAPYVFIVGPVRVQTVQKIDGRPIDKLFIDEILELYGSGIKFPSKELVSIKPKILKSLPTASKNIPITVQSVRVGHDYVRIDRKIQIDRSKIKLRPSLNTKEMVKFGGGGLGQENEAAIARIPVFNLIGPLTITAFQNTVHDANGNYKIYEEIELRADGSTAKPEITIIPFLRKVSVLPKNENDQIPIRYQEDILVGDNVMLIKRLIEIKPYFRKQLEDFSLSEERNYVTDKTNRTASSVTKSVASKITGKPKMLVLQDPPIKTDFTVSSNEISSTEKVRTAKSMFPESVESVYERDRSSTAERNLGTAISSSEMISAGKQFLTHTPT
uniref:CABIT domain-containing protein n=1 Tax=Elaeophora elaphi TaxID=1147741 RepID=A0A0R3RPZ4_9BILA